MRGEMVGEDKASLRKRYDRDVHASENMVWIYNNLVGVDGTEFKRADFEEQLDYMFNGQIKG